MLGIAIRLLIGEARYHAAKPWLKLAGTLDLILLCYSNAAVALPQAIAHPDADFLVAILSITLSLCILAFGSGWFLARLLRTGAEKRASLMYGLGMNNNGTGLVLASMALANHPRVMLPIIFYNLVQQVVAGAVGAIARWVPCRTGEIHLPALSEGVYPTLHRTNANRDGVDSERVSR
jgi:BASS family bile acid:Na+ symporter